MPLQFPLHDRRTSRPRWLYHHRSWRRLRSPHTAGSTHALPSEHLDKQSRLLEGPWWILDANLSGGDGLGKIRWNEDGRGARFAQESNVFSIRKKTDLPRSRFCERRSARDF